MLAADPSSSTEQIPMPYALRRARFTARVSATRISAPCTSGETLDGSASPNALKRASPPERLAVALTTHRRVIASQNSGSSSTSIPEQLRRAATLSSPACVTYQHVSIRIISPRDTDRPYRVVSSCSATDNAGESLPQSRSAVRLFVLIFRAS